METKNLATTLKELRTRSGMSQEYLAEESRVSLRTIQRIENNESQPTGETIKRVASALGVTLDELTNSNRFKQTSSLNTTIVFLKKQRENTKDQKELKILESFIKLLQNLKEKELNTEQIKAIESYIQYLELEKIPSFSYHLYKEKLRKFKKYLKNNLRFVPKNYYTTWTASFGIAFVIGFSVQGNIDVVTKLWIAAIVLFIIGIGVYKDLTIKKQDRALSF